MIKSQLCKIVSMIFLLSSCGQAKSGAIAQPLSFATDTVEYVVLGQPTKGEIIINDTINLCNRKCILPEGITLSFKGGLIRNGTLVGNKTKLNSSKACFERVRISGTWNVITIRSSLFLDLSYDNALKDVVALSDSTVNNRIVIEEGDYQVTANKNGDVCIPIASNTDLIINGTIRLKPNDYRNYYIIQANGNNITMRGRGSIIGDKHVHTGRSGEWGMGINLDNAHNVMIKGLTIKDCWGDCIYVGNESSDVRIENCLLDHGRRQGVSITSANGVTIKNCTITNVCGTAPEYAIDVEPNKDDTVDNVIIERVLAKDCMGGFLVYGRAPNAHVGKVTLRNCTVEYNKMLAISVQKCDVLKVEKCHVRQKPVQRVMSFEDIGNVTVINNSYHNDEGALGKILWRVRRANDNDATYTPVAVNGCKKTRFENNREK